MKNSCDHGHDVYSEIRIMPYANGNIHVCYEHYQTEINARACNPANNRDDIFPDGSSIFPAWKDLGIYYPPYSEIIGKIRSVTTVHVRKDPHYPCTEILGISDHSFIWKALYDVAAPIVTSYQSDLYYDAIIVSQFDHNTPPLWYGIGDSGTHIYRDFIEDGIKRSGKELALRHLESRPYVYECRFIPGQYDDTMQFLVIEIASPKGK